MRSPEYSPISSSVREVRRTSSSFHCLPATVFVTRIRVVAFAFATWAYRFVLFLGIALVVYHAFFKALGVFLFFVEISVFIVRPVLAELRVWHARRAEIPSRRR